MDGAGGTMLSASLCVLASGSGGNCSVLSVSDGATERLILIDAGLSPRRTARCLRDLGAAVERVEAILLTHIDTDHWNPSWRGRVPAGTRVRLHRRHAARAKELGVLPDAAEPFDRGFTVAGVRVEPALLEHDELGVCAFRLEIGDAALGFATDVGRVTARLVDHLRGVDVLAIESNYCPKMQLESDRPWFLKRRIMGGSGHLSNQQCADAINQIGPASHVVLLHLSRQCNRPELVGGLHEAADYAVTIASQFEPTRWVRVTRGTSRTRAPLTLFG